MDSERANNETIRAGRVQTEPVEGTPPTGAPSSRRGAPSNGDVPSGKNAPRRGLGQGPADIAAELVEALQGTGAKGRIFVEGLIAAGYVDNPQEFRRIYQQNKPVINRFLGQVNTERVVGGTGLEKRSNVAGQGAAAGLVGGAFLTWLLNKLI